MHAWCVDFFCSFSLFVWSCDRHILTSCEWYASNVNWRIFLASSKGKCVKLYQLEQSLCVKKTQLKSVKNHWTSSFPATFRLRFPCLIISWVAIRDFGRYRRTRRLGNTILVNLKLWEYVIVFNINFWSATGKVWQVIRHFWVLFCAILGTPKTVISNFVATLQIVRPRILPHIFPHVVAPTMFPWDKKTRGWKNPQDKTVLIPF